MADADHPRCVRIVARGDDAQGALEIVGFHREILAQVGVVAFDEVRVGRPTRRSARNAEAAPHDGDRKVAAIGEVARLPRHQLGADLDEIARQPRLAMGEQCDRESALCGGRTHDQGFQPIARAAVANVEKGDFFEQRRVIGRSSHLRAGGERRREHHRRCSGKLPSHRRSSARVSLVRIVAVSLPSCPAPDGDPDHIKAGRGQAVVHGAPAVRRPEPQSSPRDLLFWRVNWLSQSAKRVEPRRGLAPGVSD